MARQPERPGRLKPSWIRPRLWSLCRSAYRQSSTPCRRPLLTNRAAGAQAHGTYSRWARLVELVGEILVLAYRQGHDLGCLSGRPRRRNGRVISHLSTTPGRAGLG